MCECVLVADDLLLDHVNICYEYDMHFQMSWARRRDTSSLTIVGKMEMGTHRAVGTQTVRQFDIHIITIMDFIN